MKRSFLIKTTLAVFCFLTCSLHVFAGEIDANMDKIVRNFTREAQTAGFSTATLAVFPLQSNKKLEERRVNFTCSELLADSFVRAKTFSMVERAKLDTLVSEQKLGAYGFVKSATAAQLGKLVGAKLAVVGSVFKMNNMYHMNTQLVNVETGEILASDITEIPVSIFEDEAVGYLKLVPDHEAIGFYATGIMGPAAVANMTAQTALGVTVTPKNPPTTMTGFGLGIRYFPWQKWMFDLAVFANTEFTVENNLLGTRSDGGSAMGGVKNTPPMVRLTMDRIFPLSHRFNAIAGAGAMYFRLISAGNYIASTSAAAPAANVLIPTTRLGLEWKIQERFRVSVFGNYNLTRTDCTLNAIIFNGTATAQLIPVYKVYTPQFYAEATAAFYF